MTIFRDKRGYHSAYKGGDEWKKRHPPESICGRPAGKHDESSLHLHCTVLYSEAALLPGDKKGT